ncbi:MAG: hypothetical protein K6T26_07355 [Alicyclobacillus sp.]|nr:hypothetical protein [Alicyclobacillus sp.]
MAATGEEIGYEDAMRQVMRSLQRRWKLLQEEARTAEPARQQELRIRMSEVEHLQQVVESLRR